MVGHGRKGGRQWTKTKHTQDVVQCIFCDSNLEILNAYGYPLCRGVSPYLRYFAYIVLLVRGPLLLFLVRMQLCFSHTPHS